MKPAGALPDYKLRRTERTSVSSASHLHHRSWYNLEVRICDVSTGGFMAECAEPVLIGSYVSLDVPGVGPVDAQVRWQLGPRMGGMFLNPISLDQCEWVATKTSKSKDAQSTAPAL